MTTLILHGLTVERAVAALSAALTAPFDVNGAAHEGTGEGARTYVRIEGFEASLAYRAAQLRELLASFGEAQVETGSQANARIWQAHSRRRGFWRRAGRCVENLGAALGRARLVLAQIGKALDTQALLDWGGGLIWLLAPDEGDAGAIGDPRRGGQDRRTRHADAQCAGGARSGVPAASPGHRGAFAKACAASSIRMRSSMPA